MDRIDTIVIENSIKNEAPDIRMQNPMGMVIVNNGFIKQAARLRKSLLQRRLETGFSMLEAIVVVGVLLAIAVSGFVAYAAITQNAKTAAVKSAASEVHTAVILASSDGDSTTQPQDVIDDWNAITDQIHVEILALTMGAYANGDYCVSATNVAQPEITARGGECSNVTEAGG